MMVPAYKDINLLEIKEGVISGLGGEVGISFELFPKRDLRMCSSEELPGFVSGFSRLLSILPLYSRVTFEVEVQEGSQIPESVPAGHFNSNGNGAHPLLKDMIKEKLNWYSQFGRSVRYFAHLSTASVNPLKLPMLPSILPRKKNHSSVETALEQNESMIREFSETFSSSLAAINVSSEPLSLEAILDHYWKVLSPSQSMELKHPDINNRYSLRSQLACSNCMETPEHFFMDGQYHSTISFYSYPEELSLGSVDDLLEILPVGSRYLFSILVPDQEEFLEQLKAHRRRADALARSAKTKDYESQTRERELDEVISRCRQEGERIYVVWAAIQLRSEDPAVLREMEKKILFGMREIFGGGSGIVEECLQRRLFLASLPLNAHLSPRRALMPGTTASALAPLSRPWEGTKESGLILSSRTREPVFFDVFENNSPHHGIVIGTTNSGKSFTANMLLISLLSDPKIRALIIDVGGSFKRLTMVLGGAYFDMRIDQDYAINPILPRSSLTRNDGTFDPEGIAAQASLIAKMGKTTSGPGRLILEKAIERVFKKHEEPLLSDLFVVLKDGHWEDTLKGQVQLILNELMPFCEGLYSLLLSRNSKIRPFDAQITAFDLAGLKEHRILQNIMVSVIAFSLNRQLADKSIKKIVIIDEAWEFFNDEASSDLIARLYRQSRKQNAAILTLSQSPVEFLNSVVSPAILANSHWVMALKMASGHELLSKFGFSDQAIEWSKGMQMCPRSYSEVLLRFEERPARIARISPSSLEYWIATTNPNESVREEKLRLAGNLSQQESIIEMAKQEPVLEW